MEDIKFLRSASSDACWRGYDYFEKKMVKEFEAIDENRYIGDVRGSGNNMYVTTIDLKKPKKSTCTCPHAEESRRICKHKVALYFTVFPEEAGRFYDIQMNRLEAYETMMQRKYDELEKKIRNMKKDELREAVWFLLNSGPEWLHMKFIDRFVDDGYDYYD